MFTLLWQYQVNRMKRFFRVRRAAKLITVALFLAVFIGVAAGIYEFFRAGFIYISKDQYFTGALTLYIFEAFALITLLLVLFSAFIVTLFSLFRARENEWVIASPRYRLIPHYVMWQVFGSSLWPLLIIFLPGLLAVKVVFGLSTVSFLVSLLAVVLLTFFLVVFVFVLTIFVAWLLQIFSRMMKRQFFSFRTTAAVLLLIFAVLVWLSWSRAFDVDFVKLFAAKDIGAAAPNISLVADKFNIFPSHTVAAGIYDWQNNDAGLAMTRFGVLVGLVTIVVIMWQMISSRFLRLWQNLQRGSFIATTSAGSITQRASIYHFRGGYVSALFKKEALVFLRNGKSLAWFAFLVFIWLVQVGLNVVLSKMIAREGPLEGGFPVVVQALQFVTAIFFIAAFALRFVFPAFSSERRTAWILANAPIKFSKVFWAKLWFYLVIFTVIGLLVGYGNLALLGQPLKSAGVTLLLFITALPLLIIYGLSLGALFPNFETDDPSALSTTLPGFGFIVGALSYGAIGGWLQYTVLTGGSFLPIALFEIASLLIGILLLHFAPRALDHRDFVKEIE